MTLTIPHAAAIVGLYGGFNSFILAPLERRITEGQAASEKRVAESLAASEKRMTEGQAASEKRMTAGLAMGLAASEKRMTEGLAASEKRMTEGQAASEKRMTEGQAASEKRILSASEKLSLKIDLTNNDLNLIKERLSHLEGKLSPSFVRPLLISSKDNHTEHRH